MGVLDRLILSDRQWERIAGHIIGDERTRGSSGRDNRMFVEGVLWIVRTGAPWRDLPEVFGAWPHTLFPPLGSVPPLSNTTKPGRSWLSEPSPYVTQEPIEAPPARAEPVCKNSSAGAWLN